MDERLRLSIRTPHEVVVDAEVDSARVPTASGQVGLRPRQEPFIAVVEPGLVLLDAGGERRFAATAGGLLRTDRATAVLATPFAVTGPDGESVLRALDEAFAIPDSELATRRRLAELEQRIVAELNPRRRGVGDA